MNHRKDSNLVITQSIVDGIRGSPNEVPSRASFHFRIGARQLAYALDGVIQFGLKLRAQPGF